MMGVVMAGAGVLVAVVVGVMGVRSVMESGDGDVARSREAMSAVRPSLLNCDNVLFRERFRSDVVLAGVL